ncbi:MAG TPA: glycosyltransferase [Candidatus Dormibacteraeota bacterium]|jgi:ceramide glucosyltransferase|nr:glycosyltransferase [Candidatus Dormibacteraeota bacterium]
MAVWAQYAGFVLLAIAVIGTTSSTVFLVLALVGAAKFHRQAREQEHFAAQTKTLPPVSLLKPVHGAETRLRENIESFFVQDYPNYEILFAADEENDAALDVIREVAARHPQIPCRILVTGRPNLPNPPAFSFMHMAEAAACDILVTSDSDVEVATDYLSQVVPPMLEPSVGMLTCLYRGKNAGSFWSGMDAIGMSIEMTAGVVTANLLEGMKFGLGPTIVTRKDSVAKIGGYRVTAEYFSNDFVIGNFIEKAGYSVVLSRHIIDHVVPPMTFKRMWDRQVRWAKGTRWSRPKGHFGTGLIFAMPYGILGLFAGALTGHWILGLSLFLGAILNRMIESWAIGWSVVRDPVARNRAWLYPIRDLLGFAVWCASYLSKRAVWRDKRYQLVKGGRIVLRETSVNS